MMNDRNFNNSQFLSNIALNSTKELPQFHLKQISGKFDIKRSSNCFYIAKDVN